MNESEKLNTFIVCTAITTICFQNFLITPIETLFPLNNYFSLPQVFAKLFQPLTFATLRTSHAWHRLILVSVYLVDFTWHDVFKVHPSINTLFVLWLDISLHKCTMVCLAIPLLMLMWMFLPFGYCEYASYGH